MSGALQRCADWLLTKEVRRKGDWSVKRPNVEPSGWYFEFANEYYPDIDDTAQVLLALARAQGDEEALRQLAVSGLPMRAAELAWALNGAPVPPPDAAVMAQRLKFVEIGIAMVAILGFALHAYPTLSVTILFLALFGFGVIGSLFGPIKYGILPEILPHHQLSLGNGLLEMWTFLAIISGTVAGGALLDLVGKSTWIAGLLLTAAGVTGDLAESALKRGAGVKVADVATLVAKLKTEAKVI